MLKFRIGALPIRADARSGGGEGGNGYISSMSLSSSKICSDCISEMGRINDGDLGLNLQFRYSANVP